MNFFLERPALYPPNVRLLVVVTLISGLLLGACESGARVDSDYQGIDDEAGVGPVNESGILSITIISFVSLFGLMLALGRRGNHR